MGDFIVLGTIDIGGSSHGAPYEEFERVNEALDGSKYAILDRWQSGEGQCSEHYLVMEVDDV